MLHPGQSSGVSVIPSRTPRDVCRCRNVKDATFGCWSFKPSLRGGRVQWYPYHPSVRRQTQTMADETYEGMNQGGLISSVLSAGPAAHAKSVGAECVCVCWGGTNQNPQNNKSNEVLRGKKEINTCVTDVSGVCKQKTDCNSPVVVKQTADERDGHTDPSRSTGQDDNRPRGGLKKNLCLTPIRTEHGNHT